MASLPDGTLLLLILLDAVILLAASGFVALVLARPAGEPTVTGADRVAAGVLGVGAIVGAVGAVLPWGDVRALEEEYLLVTDQKAFDSTAGLVAVLGTAAVLAVCAGLLVSTGVRRVVLAALALGVVWLVIPSNSLLVLRGVEEPAVAGAGGGLWCALAGAVLAVLGAVLALARSTPPAAPPPVWTQPAAFPVSTIRDDRPDFGEGF